MKRPLVIAALVAAITLSAAPAYAKPCTTTTTEVRKPCQTTSTSTTTPKKTTTTSMPASPTASSTTTSTTVGSVPVVSQSRSGTSTSTTESDKPESIGTDTIGVDIGHPVVLTAATDTAPAASELAHTGVSVWPFIIGGLVLFILGESAMWASRKVAKS